MQYAIFLARKNSFLSDERGKARRFETEPEARTFLDAKARESVDKGGAKTLQDQIYITQYPYFTYELFKTAYAVADVLEYLTDPAPHIRLMHLALARALQDRLREINEEERQRRYNKS